MIAAKKWRCTKKKLQQTFYENCLWVTIFKCSICRLLVTTHIVMQTQNLGNTLHEASPSRKLILPQPPINFQNFMRPEYLLLCSKESLTDPYMSQTNPVHALPNYFLKTHLNVIFPYILSPRSDVFILVFLIKIL